MESQLEDEAFFAANPTTRLAEDELAANVFINHHLRLGRKMALVTSGGTIVPLEQQMVRYIDNFSVGSRGAASAEYFLTEGYAVVFLYRESSLTPFLRRFSQRNLRLPDLLVEVEDEKLEIPAAFRKEIIHTLRLHREARESGMLLSLSFNTISDYLHRLRAIAYLMQPLGPAGLIYLAAAPSDFFVPSSRLPEHKIQSGTTKSSFTDLGSPFQDHSGSLPRLESQHPPLDSKGQLVLHLEPVPKFLKNLVKLWAPDAMVISFKLETDAGMLLRKARYSLDRYQHHLVIGNLLAARKWEVVLVSRGCVDSWIRAPKPGGWGATDEIPLRQDMVPPTDPEQDLESVVVPRVVHLHNEHMALFSSSQ